MLSCSNCDASLKLNAKLCIKCGHIVTDEERESAVTGIPIKKPVVIPEVIVQKVVIPEPSIIVEEEIPRVESPVDPVFSGGFADARPLSSESSRKLDADFDLENPTPSEESAENLRLAEEADSQSKVELSTPNISPSIPLQARVALPAQEEKTKIKNSPTQSSSKLIGLALAGIVITGVSAFLFIGGDNGSKAPVASSPPVEDKEPQVVAPPVIEPQPAPKVKVEPPIAQPAKPPVVQPTQKPKSNGQQSDAPVAMPDLNKLVKDAINK